MRMCILENYHQILALESFIVSSSSVFSCPPATLLFWFALSTAHYLLNTNSWQTQLAGEHIVEHLAATDISLMIWWRLNTEEHEYWTLFLQVARNMTPY